MGRVGLPDLANKNAGYSVKFECQINIFLINISMFMYTWEYVKNFSSVVDLKFKFN